MTDIVMPRLSDSMEEGTILTWMKQVGDEIAVGDEIVEIETDKANMAYESDVAGTLTEILAEEGATLPIGEPIAKIGDASEAAGQEERGTPAGEDVASFSESPSPPPRAGSEDSEQGPAHAKGLPAAAGPGDGPGSRAEQQPGGGERVKASPVARRLAREKGVDLTTIEGSGPNGRIVKSDVKKATAAGAEPSSAAGDADAAGSVAAVAAPGPAAAETAKGTTTVEELSKLQQTVARRMSESKATAPHFYLEAEIDMSRAVAARKRIKAAAGEGEVVPSFNDMVVKACAIALGEFPKANGAYRDGRFELYSRINVGVAVAAQGALVVPTVFDADRKGLRQIATEARAVAAKVREGTITPPELSGGTFTVSNLGMFGIDNFSAVINSPQAAILAVGAIKERPVFGAGGEVLAAQLMNVTLACDHRILYGAEGAEFLARVRTLLEEPLSLAL
jgi:pyruvate dehydrogenase E2 component (dihydrolipoamide acetyltransferase)